MIGKKDSDDAALNRSAKEFQAAIDVAGRLKNNGYLMMLNNNLGNVFVSLGAGGTGTDDFSKAVAAYRAALAVVAPEVDPLNHAYVQVSLGEALMKLAERNRDPSAVEDAIAAFRPAEKIYDARGQAELLAEARTNIATAEAFRTGLRQ